MARGRIGGHLLDATVYGIVERSLAYRGRLSCLKICHTASNDQLHLQLVSRDDLVLHLLKHVYIPWSRYIAPA
jgi:hypothetical protein